MLNKNKSLACVLTIEDNSRQASAVFVACTLVGVSWTPSTKGLELIKPLLFYCLFLAQESSRALFVFHRRAKITFVCYEFGFSALVAFFHFQHFFHKISQVWRFNSPMLHLSLALPLSKKCQQSDVSTQTKSYCLRAKPPSSRILKWMTMNRKNGLKEAK